MLAIAGLVGAILGYLARRVLTATKIRTAESYAERLVADARAQQKEIILEGKDEVLQAQRAAEDEARERRADFQRQERLLLDRSESLDRKSETLERREAQAEERITELETEKAQVAVLRAQQLTSLEHIGGLSAGEARQTLIREIEEEAQAEASQRVRDIERRAIEDGEERSRRILTTVMQRMAADHTSEATVTVVHLPNDDMKGRIIGREGRNIRALEQATGVDLIIDDTPEAVVLSGFDPVRREVARMALTKLIADGRIHPGPDRGDGGQVPRRRSRSSCARRGSRPRMTPGVPGLHAELIRLLGPAEVPDQLRPERPEPLRRDRAPGRDAGG